MPAISHYCWSWTSDVSRHCFLCLPHSVHSVYEVYPCCGCGSSSFFLIAKNFSTLWVPHYVFIGFWLVRMWVPSVMWSYECSCMSQEENRCFQFLLYRSRNRLPDRGKCYILLLEETSKHVSRAVAPCYTLHAMTIGYFVLNFLLWLYQKNGNHLLSWRLQWHY